jgi:hypothetical protein
MYPRCPAYACQPLVDICQLIAYILAGDKDLQEQGPRRAVGVGSNG